MNYETKNLKTKRLVIKKGTIEDFLKVYEYDFKKLTDVDGIFKLEKQDLTKISKIFGKDIDKYYKKAEKAHVFDWIIYLDNNAIGNIVTENEDIKRKTIELIFNIHPVFWGKGYIVEALEEVMSYLYSIGYESIVCKYKEGNNKAKRVLEKVGFKPYMIDKDAYKTENGNLIDDYEVIMEKEDFLSRTLKISIEKLKI